MGERTYMLSASELQALINYCLWFKNEMQDHDDYQLVCDLDEVTVGDLGVTLRTRGVNQYSELRLDEHIDANFPGAIHRTQLRYAATSTARSAIAKYQSAKEPTQ